MKFLRNPRALGVTLAVGAALLLPALALADPQMRVGHVFRDAGEAYSVSGKGEAKVAFVDGAWWGAFSSASGVDLFRLQGTTWVKESFAGSHLTDDPNARADVLFDGSELLVLMNVDLNGTTVLRLWDYQYVRPSFHLRGGYPVTVVANTATDRLEDDVHTMVEDSHRRLWVAYRAGAQVGVKASSGTGSSGWLTWKAPVTFGYLGNGVAESLSNSAIVAFGSGTSAAVGILWADQSAPPVNGYYFRYHLDSSSDYAIGGWSTTETAYTNGNELVANDQIMVVPFEGSIYAIAKTDTIPTSSAIGMDRFILLVRDPSGTWTKTTVARIESQGDVATRAQIAIDAEHRKIYSFWHKIGIVGKITSVDAPDFLDAPYYSFIDPGSETNWDSQTTHQLLSSRTGLMIVADDNSTGFQYWNLVNLGTPGSDQPASVLSTISVSPQIAAVDTGGQVQYTASAKDQFGQPFAITPTWVANGGAIDQTGLYTAGGTTGVYGIAATQSETAHGTAFVGPSPVVMSISISPDPATVQVSQTLQLSAVGVTPQGGSVALAGPIEWSIVSGVGSVTSQGVYQAPSSEGRAVVAASSAGLTAYDSILVVTPPSSGGGSGGSGGGTGGTTQVGPLARIVIAPSQASVAENGSLGFSAQGFDAQGNVVAVSPTWSATGGTISSNGVFVAGKEPGTFSVTATDNGISASAPVTVTAPSPTGGSTSGGFTGGGGGHGGGGGGCAIAPRSGSSPLGFLPFAFLGLVIVIRRSRAQR